MILSAVGLGVSLVLSWTFITTAWSLAMADLPSDVLQSGASCAGRGREIPTHTMELDSGRDIVTARSVTSSMIHPSSTATYSDGERNSHKEHAG
jgi:hypothetical protein